MMIESFWPRLVGAAGTERHRWPLWLPVMLGMGAGLYFALDFEPAAFTAWAAWAGAFATILASIFGRWRITLALLAALLLGFGMAKLREEQVAAPVLSHATTLHLTGRVLSVDPAAYGSRLVVGDLRSGGFAGAAPGRARIALEAGWRFDPATAYPLRRGCCRRRGRANRATAISAGRHFFKASARWVFPMARPFPRRWRRRRALRHR